MASPYLENAQQKMRDRDTAAVIPLRAREEQEWSEAGRKADIPPGWYVIPAFLLTLTLLATVFLLF